jgi:hypothetical protein
MYHIKSLFKIGTLFKYSVGIDCSKADFEVEMLLVNSDQSTVEKKVLMPE